MDKKKIAELIAKAKKHYSTNSHKYDVILTYSNQRIQNWGNPAYATPTVQNPQLYSNQNPQQQFGSVPMHEQQYQNDSEHIDKKGLSSLEIESSDVPVSSDPNQLPDTSNFTANSQLQQTPMQTQAMPYNGPPIQVISNTPASNTPINIVAKNYFNPDSFDEEEKKEVKPRKSVSLAKIPDNLLKKSATDWEPINYRNVNEKYDLFELAKTHITYDEEDQKVLYQIIEPELTDDEKEYYEELRRGFIYVFERVASEDLEEGPQEIIVQGARRLCAKYKIKLSPESLEKLIYYLKRDFLGLEMIEPLMHDPYIEDVSCDGLGIPIFVNHLKYGPLEVNRKYTSPEKLNSFIVKLAQKTNQEISLSKPILQGALPDGSRVEAIYGKEISEKGSSYTLRKFRAEPFTPIHLIDFGTMPPFLLAYLWLAVENKQSILVSGGTATGKTTILNALSLFVPPTSKIVSIEDTPEINLPHEHWLPMIARESQEKATVTMFDLLKASLRERPDFIIVGEIRGEEASILFQGMATGHAGLGTVHAEKFEDLVNRMTIDPINLPKQLITEMDIAIFMKQMKIKSNIVRRCSAVVEVVEYSSKKDQFTTNDFVEFDPSTDEFSFSENSSIISNLLKLRGGSEDALWSEIEKRRRILDIMHKKSIIEFRDVSSVIKAYYKAPSDIFSYLETYQLKEREQ